MKTEPTKKKAPAKTSKKGGKAGVSVKGEKSGSGVHKKTVSGKQAGHRKPKQGKANTNTATNRSEGLKNKISRPNKKINCMLPGAELLAEGKSVEEVMAALDEQQASSLDAHEEKFCQEYVSCGVAVRSALRVWPDMAYETAHVRSSRMLQKVTIKARIAQITEEHKERYGLTDAKVLKRLAALAMFDRRTLHREDGSLKSIHELTEEEAAAITEIESVELFDGKGEQRQAIGLVRKVKFADPKGAIELAGRHLKLWNDVGSKNNPLVELTDDQIDAKLAALEEKLKG